LHRCKPLGILVVVEYSTLSHHHRTTIPRKTAWPAREQGTTRTQSPCFTSLLCYAHFPATFPQATSRMSTHLTRRPATFWFKPS